MLEVGKVEDTENGFHYISNQEIWDTPTPPPDNVERNAQWWNNQHEDSLHHILDSDHLGPGPGPGPGPDPLPALSLGPPQGASHPQLQW